MNLHQSVYFYTFHKYASSLFSNVLPNVEGLQHIDYANKIYTGEAISPLEFNEKGSIYDPIRLSAKTHLFIIN